jgi:hypothetical protein
VDKETPATIKACGGKRYCLSILEEPQCAVRRSAESLADAPMKGRQIVWPERSDRSLLAEYVEPYETIVPVGYELHVEVLPNRRNRVVFAKASGSGCDDEVVDTFIHVIAESPFSEFPCVFADGGRSGDGDGWL